MSDWRVVVADDERAARRGVSQQLASHPEFRIVGECATGTEVLDILEHDSPDVLFLDLQMPEINGIEALRRSVSGSLPVVVILTAYPQFAVQAFEAEACDYLVKPVSTARFEQAIGRVLKRLRAVVPAAPSIMVSTSKGITVVQLTDIDWLEAADNYARVWTRGRSYLLRESLDRLERRMRSHGFVRAHRQALVRIAAIKEIRTVPSGEHFAVLTCDARVPISRRRRAEFSSAIRNGFEKGRREK